MTSPRTTQGATETLPERLRALLARARDGVWVTAADGRIVFWNRAAEAVLGHCARDVVGRACAEVVGGRDDRGRPVCARGCDAASLPSGGVERTFGVPARTKRGRRVWLEVTAVAADGALANGHAPTPFVVHVFHDATRGKELVRALREQAGAPAAGVRLTPREGEVLRLMSQGLGTAATAERLRVSRATIRNHVQNIFGKLGVHTRVEAVVHATQRRLV
jgi:PAS domain S-box-containing protein